MDFWQHTNHNKGLFEVWEYSGVLTKRSWYFSLVFQTNELHDSVLCVCVGWVPLCCSVPETEMSVAAIKCHDPFFHTSGWPKVHIFFLQRRALTMDLSPCKPPVSLYEDCVFLGRKWLYMLFIYLFLLSLWNKFSFCSLGLPRTHGVVQAGLGLAEVLLPQTLKSWDYRHEPLGLALSGFFSSCVCPAGSELVESSKPFPAFPSHDPIQSLKISYASCPLRCEQTPKLGH